MARATKVYEYDGKGRRISMIDRPYSATGAPLLETRYYFGYEPHGSVSLLWDATANAATASYGYRPYGSLDPQLTKGDPKTVEVFNPFRYQAQRFDTGSGAVDMGFRRYAPSIGHFLQRDAFQDALGDLGLALDPLSQNRYALTGGNPVSFVEYGGHYGVDEAWKAEFESIHRRPPTEQDAFDRMISIVHPELGSGPGGSWTDADWRRTYEARQAAWNQAAVVSGVAASGRVLVSP